MRGVSDIIDKKCAVCGKTISMIYPERWCYKVTVGSENRPQRTYYCCSWKCLRQMPEKPKKGERGQKEIVCPLIKEGKSNEEIIRETGVSAETIRYWRKKYAY